MKFIPGKLAGSYLVELEPFSDERGWFARYYCKKEFSKIGHSKEWVQLNHSVTNKKGTIRGMHYQLPPFSEIKMVKCITGKVLDIIVDLRKNSGTFLQWEAFELSAENGRMVYIPEGFAHGFQCLEDHCGLIYHHSEYYTPGAEGGINYQDPRLNISWPLEAVNISQRDSSHKLLEESFNGI